MRDRLFRWVLAHPVWVLLLAVGFAVAATMGAQKLVFKGDYRVFFSEENPQLTAYESMQKIYSKSDNVAFVIAPADGQVFTAEHLEAIRQLTEEAWQIPYSTRVDSLSNYQHTVAEEDDLIVEDLVLEDAPLGLSDLERIRRVATTEPQLVHKLVDPEGRVSVVNVTIQLPGKDPVTEGPEVATKVRQLVADFEAANPGSKVHLSGMVMMNVAFTEASLADNATLVPLMFGVVILAIGLLLRTITGTVSTLVIIIVSITSTMGLAGWSGMYLTGPSASAPTMILTLAVADCIHILTTMFYDMRHGSTKRDALMHSLKLNFQPILLTSVTTAIGFLSMNFSDSPPFRDLGNLVATGVMLAFIFSITLFPALLMMLPLRVQVRTEESTDLMDRIASFVVKRRRALLPGMTAVIIGLSLFVPNNELNDEFVKYFDQSVPFRAATDFQQENLSGMTVLEVSIDSGRASGINDPAYLKMMDEFTHWLRAQPETDHVNSLSDTFKRLNKNMHADDQSWYRLPDSQELAAQYLLLYEMSLPYGLDLNNQLNVDKSAVRLIGTFENVSSTAIIALESQIYDWFAQNANYYDVTVTSPSLMFSHIGQRNAYSMLLGTVAALLLISLLLGLALRSVRYGVLSLIPNLAPAAVGFGLWALWDGQVGLGLSVVVGMTLGIVVDDTVHFLSKYLHARDDKGLDAEKAVKYAFGSVGRALWITTLVLVAGFMVLAQSSFKMNADMGLLTAGIILVALIIDFLFLPPLLIKLDNLLSAKRYSTPGQAPEAVKTLPEVSTDAA
ncbi:RND family transporter [Motiliproteus coralliicola]|uniref:RND family transporter n=1 Tax=Motiliproteus coralliicola TaxID=2283196 RepID=A0A369WAJ3_9GAMM|nr:MMPL family transporter [Motiliproteus coralliicola]RDE19030.1 RND family transporter [Motiliproteus coralliicola]